MKPDSGAFVLPGTKLDWPGLGMDPNIIALNSARIKGRVLPSRVAFCEGPVAIVGSGPSLNDTWEQIRDFKYVYTCAGAHRFLIDRDIIPTYHVDSDPRPYKAGILGVPHPDVTYLISSICDQTYFDKLELYNAKVKLWHILFFEKDKMVQYPNRDWICTGANLAGPRTIKMARIMGYNNLHVFGIDGSIKGTRTHAHEHPNPPHDFRTYTHEGKVYGTIQHWVDHMSIMFDDLDRLRDTTVKFYGEGLIQAVAKTRIPRDESYVPLMVMKDWEGMGWE